LRKKSLQTAEDWTNVQPRQIQSAGNPTTTSAEEFQGISLDLPSPDLEDIHDIDTNVGFSNRGSLILNPPDLNKPLPPPAMLADTSPSRAPSPGRQSLFRASRILTTEETTQSERLRMIYEHGDEGVGNEARPMSPPGATAPSLVISKNRQLETVSNGWKSSPRRMSSVIRTVTEVAGGNEDYSGIENGEVDRYGFIYQNQSTPRPSVAPSRTSNDASSLHRVSSFLRRLSESPRRNSVIARVLSTASRRTSKISIPDRANAENQSLHSSTKSRRSISGFDPFSQKSRNRRLMSTASDMLTIPISKLDPQKEAQTIPHESKFHQQRERIREEKWRKMAVSVVFQKGLHGETKFRFNISDPKIIRRVWKGIPDKWRATAWHSFLSQSAENRGVLYASDETLTEEFFEFQDQNCADDAQIDVDVPRTIGSHVMFRKRYRGGQRLLFRVLHALSLKFPDIGYVQGMASMASTLLCYFDEEMTFIMMVRLWELRGLKALFAPGFHGLISALQEFEREWLREGDVALKLKLLGIDKTTYGTRWYLTLFNHSVPFAAQLRIWDVFMLLGDATRTSDRDKYDGADLDVLHASSAALIDATSQTLLDADFEDAMRLLTSWMPIKDEDILMRVAQAEWKAKKRRDK